MPIPTQASNKDLLSRKLSNFGKQPSFAAYCAVHVFTLSGIKWQHVDGTVVLMNIGRQSSGPRIPQLPNKEKKLINISKNIIIVSVTIPFRLEPDSMHAALQ
jgi:hypothetical protein